MGLLYRLGKEKHELVTGGLEQIIEYIKKCEQKKNDSSDKKQVDEDSESEPLFYIFFKEQKFTE